MAKVLQKKSRTPYFFVVIAAAFPYIYDMKRSALFIVLLVSLAAVLFSERVYSLKGRVNIREGPGLAFPVADRMDVGNWYEVRERREGWLKIDYGSGKSGFVKEELTGELWIRILKRERRLELLRGDSVLKSFPVGLGFDSRFDKQRQGDGRTPEGRFFVAVTEVDPQPAETYGPVSFRISYPGCEDARRGLASGLISKGQYLDIVRAARSGELPPQDTALGGSIKIHGGVAGSGSDWTLGCAALDNAAIRELHAAIGGQGVMVEIYGESFVFSPGGSENPINGRILAAARKLLETECFYTRSAQLIIPMKFPLGDIDPAEGVCSDVAIRALRGAGIDLQALIYEDLLVNPRRYPQVASPNPNIDHRRVRNLKIFLDYHARSLTLATPREDPRGWLPGDIVLLDTGIDNGTVFDHIGIVSDRRSPGGDYLVINLWAVGSQLNEMDLLNGDYPVIVGHYRLEHNLY
jgi:uncharacterized protein YijF (DUF1287 family)